MHLQSCPQRPPESVQGAPVRADTNYVLRSNASSTAVHERVLTLPEGFLVRRSGSHWAVVGHTGLFLIGKAGDDPEAAAERTAMGAHRIRNGLAKVLDVVSFVDPVLVSAREGHVNGCTMVEADLLESFIANGPTVISEGELQLLRHHLPGVITSIELDGGLC